MKIIAAAASDRVNRYNQQWNRKNKTENVEIITTQPFNFNMLCRTIIPSTFILTSNWIEKLQDTDLWFC